MHDNWPQHIQNLLLNYEEVAGLITIQDYLSPTITDSRKKIEVLNKSCVVLLIATWEAYIEDLATKSFDFLFSHAHDPSVFPNKVLSLAVKNLHVDTDRSKLWQLAGNGWKNILSDHRELVLENHIGKLNTPRPDQINSLFKNLIGIPNISSQWKWRNMSNAKAKERLSKLITLRGEIAHTVQASRKVRTSQLREDVKFITRLAVISSNRISTFLEQRTNEAPWDHVRYNSAS